MQTLIVFDIGNDKLRTHIENACLDYGMQRTQFSLFQGELDAQRRRKLAAKLRALVDKHAEQENNKQKEQSLVIHCFALCSADFKDALEINRQKNTPAAPVIPPVCVIL